MARPATGQIIESETARGASYALRFRAYGERRYVTLGTEADGWSYTRAEDELTFVLAQVRRGEWQPPLPATTPRAEQQAPTFHEFASGWLEDRKAEIRPRTYDIYRWEIVEHLLPYFTKKLGRHVDEITVEDVDNYRREKLAAGKLGATSINKTISRLASILDLAVEYGLIDRNPAMGKRRRAKVTQKPRRVWLEPDQVSSLLDGARTLDRQKIPNGLPHRRPLLATMAWAGLRVGEVCALRWRDVNLASGSITVAQSKTEAGVRKIDLQPELRDELALWKDETPFGKPDDLVFPAATGAPLDRHRIRQRTLLRSAAVANERQEKAGKPLLPIEGLSPHALRRSFASWLIAEGEDPAYVMDQMGHTDSSMTLEIYAKAVRNGRRSARSRRRESLLADQPNGQAMGSNAETGDPHTSEVAAPVRAESVH